MENPEIPQSGKITVALNSDLAGFAGKIDLDELYKLALPLIQHVVDKMAPEIGIIETSDCRIIGIDNSVFVQAQYKTLGSLPFSLN